MSAQIELLKTHYTNLYLWQENNDSPNKSRINMVNKLTDIIKNSSDKINILDVWSGLML